MKVIKETNTITTISSSEEEESVVAGGYISEDLLSVIDEGETVVMSILGICLAFLNLVETQGSKHENIDDSVVVLIDLLPTIHA